MAILDFCGAHPRNRIALVGEDPPGKVPPTLAGYEWYRFDDSYLTEPGRLNTTGAVIFTQAAEKPVRVFRDLERYAPILLWHDCRVFVRPVSAEPGANGDAFRRMVVNALNTLGLPPSGLSNDETKQFDSWDERLDGRSLTPWVYVLGSPDIWIEVAVLLRNNPAGVPPRIELDIRAVDSESQQIQLTPEQEVLLRRAFWDCSAVQLGGLDNGLSGVSAFRAFANMPGTVGSKWPYLYFVKLGERSKIAKEFLAYRENALEYVPYHLGPRLRLDRCALGRGQGILVSDYVNGAETLRDCARDGRAVPTIANLFNSTLWAWRNGAQREQTSLQQYLSEQMPLRIPPHRKPLIDNYGASRSPEELKALLMAGDSQPVLVGVVHGDLHATNVLVRGNDAIIIDFEKVGTRAPLLRDMASLEGGLFVDGFVGDRRIGMNLLKSVECLYEVAAFDGSVVPCHPSDGCAWFFDCVRQIRMQATQVELAPRQYALALAAALAHKACNEEDFRDDMTRDLALSREDMRALAYVLAERILVGMSR